MRLRPLLSVLFLVFIVSEHGVAQAAQVSPKEPFVSLEGGFTIALPPWANSSSGVKPIAGYSTGGLSFLWRLADGSQFQIGYVDRILKSDDKAKVLEAAGDELIAEQTKSGQTLVYRKPLEFKGYPGTELRFTIEGGTAQARYVLVGNRMFVLITAWTLGKVPDPMLKILDSFDLINAKKVIAERLEKATPPGLPQKPQMKFERSDAAMDNLKGRVKFVSSWKRYQGLDASSDTVQTDESTYDSTGNLLKKIRYDYRGNPSDVVVYGFIDGKRVAKRGAYINYEYNPPPMAPPPPPARMPSSGPTPVQAPSPAPSPQRKQPDDRFSSSYEFKFDDKKRLMERLTRNNRDEVSWRAEFSFNEGNLEELNYSNNGKITKRIVVRMDERGNPVEETYFSNDTNFPDNSVYTYQYVKFDTEHNWIERTAVAKTAKYKGGTNEIRYVEYRQITYH